MPFAPSDHVFVESLGKGVVREVRRGARYLVEIKGRSLLVHEAQLSPLEERKPRQAEVRQPPTEVDSPTRAHALASLDLHGMTTDEAVAALDNFLNDALLAGLAEVRVIHGRSGGRLKLSVHARLKGIPTVRAYRLDPRNAGVTIVAL
jgi:DNA mismatch repair protein MutS2